jgi:hypothetical protein
MRRMVVAYLALGTFLSAMCMFVTPDRWQQAIVYGFGFPLALICLLAIICWAVDGVGRR